MTVAHSKRNLSSELLHDMRTPLNQIIGYSEMLVEQAPEQENFTTDLQKIRTAGQRMLEIIDENFTVGTEKAAATLARHEQIPPPPRRETTATDPGVLLVIDDDANNRDVLSRRLSRQGHAVRTASNGVDALRLMRETAFDVILLDIMMPEMDGHEVLRQIKATPSLQQIAVIMISAVNEVQSVVRCIEAGAEDYLTKPFDPTLLRARVDSCLQKKRARDREAALFSQLRDNFNRLQELEKVRDDMRNMIVHDLRTPLTSVIAGVEMLDKVGSVTAEQKQVITFALNGGKTLLGMINDLLDVEKLESGRSVLHLEELSAPALVAEALQQVIPLASDAQTEIVTNVPEDLPRFTGDEKKLTRTLVNLIANAIKFTGAGIVTITVSTTDEDVRFAVRDTGYGIAQEALGRIFEKFGQLDSRTKVGTGLGLAFCKLAVEAHGGEITVESAPGVGSTFAFTIPRDVHHQA